MDGLSLAVQEMFGLDPFCGAVFVSRAKRANRQSFRIQRTGIADRVSLASAIWPSAAHPGRRTQARERLDPGRGSPRFLPNVATLDVRSRLLCATGQRTAPCSDCSP
ncbi:MAG: hypothetical protein ACK4S8_15515 [Alishewanella aestuarii]